MKKIFILSFFVLLSLCVNAYDFEVDGIFNEITGDDAVEVAKPENHGDYKGDIIIPNRITYNSKGKHFANIVELGYESRKTWDFTKGVSAATRAALDADVTTWDKTVNVDTQESTAWTSKVNFDGELTAGGAPIAEFAGLTFSNFGATNAVLYRITTLRLSKKAKITLPALNAGQKIAISAQSANNAATDRGFVFTNAVNENNESTILVPGPDGAVTINLTVVADGVVDIETGVTGAAAGVEINSIIIDEGDKNIKKWDFSAWSEATKAQVTTAEDWTKAESATKEYITGDEIRWCLAPTMDANGNLATGGVAIAEMEGLHHSDLAAYSYGIAFDYQNTQDGNNWGPYHGGSYLWVTDENTSIIVPDVMAGSTLKLGVESHKINSLGGSDARGFRVTVDGVEVGSTQTTTEYKEFEYSIPANGDKYVDVTLTATRGVHLYFIEAEVKSNYHIIDADTVVLDGYLTEALMAEVNALKKVKYLDLSGVTNTRLTIGGIITLEKGILPTVLQSYDGVLTNCPNLLEVVLGNTVAIPAGAFAGSGVNTNMIVYAPAGTANSYTGNVVIGGVADDITLVDGKNLSVSTEFTAKHISYTREFYKITYYSECGGWETITLPFDVESIEHGGSRLAPFKSDMVGERNFWLAGLTSRGFGRASRIQANIPYIICMPNSEEYSDWYNIKGEVTFSAQNVMVHPTSEACTYSCAEFDLIPTYTAVTGDADVYPINNEEYDGRHPGSVFVSGLRSVRPFEAYASRSHVSLAKTMFVIGDVTPTGIMGISTNADAGSAAYFDLLGRPTTSSDNGLCIMRDGNGRYVKVGGRK